MSRERGTAGETAPSSLPKRLLFLDGLRGLSALYVLLFHAATVGAEGGGEPSALTRFLQLCFSQGRSSVVFFIVLSGFSLMLPLARANSHELVGGFQHYLYRRARRILPPYYAALALSIAIIVGYNLLAPALGMGAPVTAALEPGSIVSHVFLFHNLSFEWTYRINGPMWSVATEWQIYFLFPFLLLPLFRWTGGAVASLVAYAVSSLPFFLLPPDRNFFWACPWFVGSFALGMYGALIAASPAYRDSSLRNRTPWGSLAGACFAVVVVLVATGRAEIWSYPALDAVVSLLAFFSINACVARLGRDDRRSFWLRVLSARSVVYLGGFSYSLYLMQHPLLRLTEKALSKLSLSYDAFILVHLFAMAPLVIAGSWLFSEFFERPFTQGAIVLPAVRRRLGLAPAR